MSRLTAISSAILTLLLPCSVLSQQTGSVTGTVVDRETRAPLAGANVVIAGSALGCMTDTTGRYAVVGVPAGPQRVRASYLGYVVQENPVEISAGLESVVGFALIPSPLQTPPIVVSATRGRERETPASFSTLEQAQIRERYTTQDIPVLLSDLPSTTFYSEAGNGIGYTYLNIRGFDARRVAVMINGIPQNDPEDHNVYWLDFPDLAGSLDDIQVQRGAGSAFYGPPAIGGSVNLVTENFARERSLRVSAGLGSFNTRKYSLSLSSGLIDNRYAIHGRLSKILSSGYRDRSWVDFNSYFLGLIRYDDDMTTQINVYGGPISDHLAYYGIPREDVGNRDRRKANPILREEEIENFSQPHFELFHEWRVSPSLTVNTTLFLVLGDGFFDYDGSWAPYSYFRLTGEQGFPVTGGPDTLYFGSALIRATVTNKQFGWLPRVTWDHAGGRLVAGAEVRVHRSVHWGRLQRADGIPVTPVGVPEDYRYYDYRGAKDILSLYAHEMYRLRDDLTLMLDLLYAFNRYRLYDEKFIGTNFSVPYHFLNPRAGVNYNIDPHWNTYISAAYTSREPRLKNLYDAAEASTPAAWGAVTPQFARNPDGSSDFSTPLVTPESLLDIELGGGYSDERASATLNFYWMEFTDEIVKSGQVDRFGQPITGNAERTRHAGVELTAVWRPATGLELGGNLTLSRNRFVRHTDYSTGSPVRLDGNPIAGFPDLLGNLRGSWTVQDLTLSLSGKYVGKQYTDNFRNDARSVDPFTVVGGSGSYRLRDMFGDVDLEVMVQVSNIFDVLYAAYGEADQFFVGAGRSFFVNVAVTL